MLRLVFVVCLLVVGGVMALGSPLNALLLYLWIAYFRPEYWVHTRYLVTLDLSYYSGLLLVARTLLSGIRLRIDLRSLLLFALLAHSGISTWLGVDPAWSFLYYRDFFKSTIITYLISVLASDYKSLRLIVLVMALSLSFEGAKQGWAQLVLNPGAQNLNDIPFLGDNNLVAVGVLMMLPILVTLARTARTRWERWLHYFLAVGMLYRSISSYSRGGFLAAIALAIAVVARSHKKVRTLIGVAVAATLALSVMPDSFWERMDTIARAERRARQLCRLPFALLGCGSGDGARPSDPRRRPQRVLCRLRQLRLDRCAIWTQAIGAQHVDGRFSPSSASLALLCSWRSWGWVGERADAPGDWRNSGG